MRKLSVSGTHVGRTKRAGRRECAIFNEHPVVLSGGVIESSAARHQASATVMAPRVVFRLLGGRSGRRRRRHRGLPRR